MVTMSKEPIGGEAPKPHAIHKRWDMTDVVYRVDQFHHLPWSMLKPEGCSRDWSFGKGGYGLPSDSWHIKIVMDEHGDLWHIWEIPAAIVAMMELKSKCDVERARREIRDQAQTLGEMLGFHNDKD